MNIIFCCSFIGLKNLKFLNIEGKTIYITHNKKIKKILQNQDETVIYIYSPLPNNKITRPIVILSYIYYSLVSWFISLVVKDKNIYHDIQGYAISEYIIIKQLSRNNNIYKYTDVAINPQTNQNKVYQKWYKKIFGIKIIKEKYNDEIFFYFPEMLGEKVSLNYKPNTHLNKKLDNTVFLYLGGIVESKLMSNITYFTLLESLTSILMGLRVCVKHHPRFNKYNLNPIYTNDWLIAKDDTPAEDLVGSNCIAIGFQTFALCNKEFIHSLSLIEFSEKKEQVFQYRSYLQNNSKKIIFKNNLNEISEFIDKLPENFDFKHER